MARGLSINLDRFSKDMQKLVWGEIRKERRAPIPSDIKKAVYERANRRCECCGMPLKMSQGEFHHLRKPTVKPRPSNLQFLCPTHHNLGHKREIRTVRSTMLETRREPYIVRKRVRKHPSSPYWREKTKRTARRKKRITRRKIKSTATKSRKKKRKKRSILH